MKKLLTVLIVLYCTTVYSQEKYSEKEGNVTIHELQMTSYEDDPDAEALVIYNNGEFRFIPDDTKGFILNMTYKVKIKILKQAGESYAKISIPTYNGNRGFETATDISAVTYNWDGNNLQKTEFNKKDIFEEKVNDNVTVTKFALSDVRVGSVIEYTYKIKSPYYFNMRDWNFQNRIPALSSTLKYRALPYYEYVYIVKGINEFDILESNVDNTEFRFRNLVYKEVEWVMGMKNLPAFKDESFITTPKDYIVGMNFQLSKVIRADGSKTDIISTWKLLCEDFLKDDNFGKYIKSSEKNAKTLFKEFNIADKTDLEKIEVITNYVKNNYKWDGYLGKYANDKLSIFLKNKTGNSGNINLYLIGLLKASGLSVKPVVLSTRNNGIIHLPYPFQKLLNYVVAEVEVGEQKYYLDATDPTIHFTQLPEHCVNMLALVVQPKKEEWIGLVQNTLAATHYKFKIKIIPKENKQEIEMELATYGRDAKRFRNAAQKEGKKENENLIEFLKENNNITVKDSLTFNNLYDLEKPFSFAFSSNRGIERTGDKIFINPFNSLTPSKNIFNQKTRTHPIDLVYSIGNKYSSEIEIPEGYDVDYIPKNKNVDKDAFTVKYNTQIKDNKIIVEAEYLLKDSMYPAESYNALKTVMKTVINQFSEMIVLKRQEIKE